MAEMTASSGVCTNVKKFLIIVIVILFAFCRFIVNSRLASVNKTANANLQEGNIETKVTSDERDD